MRTKIAILLIAICFCVISFRICHFNRANYVARKCSPSVAYVELYVSDYKIGSASGFLVAKGILMTAAHVTEHADRIDIYFADSNEPYRSVDIITPDCNDDLGFVIFNADVNCPATLKFDNDIPYLGMDVITIGSPLGREQFNTISKGILSGIDRNFWDYGNPVYQIDAPTTFGNSGCPVFDGEGEVMGMVISGYDNGDICFCVTSMTLEREFSKFKNGLKRVESWEIK